MNRECKFLYLLQKCLFNKEDLVNKGERSVLSFNQLSKQKNTGFLLYLKCFVINDYLPSASSLYSHSLDVDKVLQKEFLQILRVKGSRRRYYQDRI